MLDLVGVDQVLDDLAAFLHRQSTQGLVEFPLPDGPALGADELQGPFLPGVEVALVDVDRGHGEHAPGLVRHELPAPSDAGLADLGTLLSFAAGVDESEAPT